jgi:hypothetical protein
MTIAHTIKTKTGKVPELGTGVVDAINHNPDALGKVELMSLLQSVKSLANLSLS